MISERFLLKELLTTNLYKNISFIVFNQEIVWEQDCTIMDEFMFTKLLEKLEKTTRKGFSDANVLPSVNIGTVILFAEEKPLFGTLNIAPWVPFFQIISTSKNNDLSFAETLQNVTEGGIIPIHKVTSEEALTYISFEQSLPSYKTLLAREDVMAFGKVITPEGNPIANVSIQIQGQLNEYTSNQKGRFKVPANPGDVLLFKALGKYPISQQVENLKDTLVITMAAKYTELEEVIVKNTLSQRYGFDSIQAIERINNRNYPIRNTIYKEELQGSYTSNPIDFLERDYGYKTYFVPPIGKYITILSGDPYKGNYASWIVDGKPGSPKDVGFSGNIERISIYKGIPTRTNPIPSRIIVTTKLALHLREQQGRDLDFKLTKNKFEQEVLSLCDLKPEIDFDKTFKEIDPLEWEAHYEILKLSYYNQVPFYVNISKFFQKRDSTLAEKVRMDLVILAKQNEKALKVAAFLYDEIEQYNISKKIYRRILQLDSEKAENYRHLAIACANSNKELESFYWFF